MGIISGQTIDDLNHLPDSTLMDYQHRSGKGWHKQPMYRIILRLGMMIKMCCIRSLRRAISDACLILGQMYRNRIDY